LLVRTWHRPIDRLTTKWVPHHRYRCTSGSCQWEGNFRLTHPVVGSSHDPNRVPARELHGGSAAPPTSRTSPVRSTLRVLAVLGVLWLSVSLTIDLSPAQANMRVPGAIAVR